jgi:hypothetical protein
LAPVLGAVSLPALTGSAHRLLDDFSRVQSSLGDEAAGKAARALRILGAWLGADAPFREADVRAMAGLRPGVQVRRVLIFLAARDMLIPDTGRQAEPRQHAVYRLLASLPGQIGREASTWVTVVRGHGRVPHPALAYKTIRNYLAYLMPVADLIHLQAADLNLAAGTLTIRRGYRCRVVYLDEVTAALASRWLRYRHQRWPGSRNPHLLVSQQTAVDTSPVGPNMFEPLGVRPDRLRQDRILDEARHTADPVHLVRVFGITESTAIYYVHAAHPGRQSVIPRQ